MLGVEFDFDVSALRKKMIIEKHILQVDLVIKSIANSSALTITTTAIDTHSCFARVIGRIEVSSRNT
jgi:acetylornithine aminotransferase